MAVNLHLKYSKQIEQVFALESVIAGKLSRNGDFVGVKTVRISSLITQVPNDYNRAGTTARFGAIAELQDEVQELSLSQEKSFNMAIDKANDADQDGIKQAGVALQLEIEEQITPQSDKYALAKIGREGNSVVLGAAVSKTTIIPYILAARTAFVNAKVPVANRYLFIKTTSYAFVSQAAEFIAADTGVGAIAEKGVVGMIAGFKVVECPDDYLPTSCEFIAIHRDAASVPFKMSMSRIIDSEQIDGKLLQGHYYYDAFVIGKKAGGIYAGLTNGSSVKVATPTATQGGVGDEDKYTLASTAGSTIKYTLDGTDPRYSTTAESVATGTVITLTAAVTLGRFVGIKADMFSSALLEKALPIT
jgi:hypothetical protein